MYIWGALGAWVEGMDVIFDDGVYSNESYDARVSAFCDLATGQGSLLWRHWERHHTLPVRLFLKCQFQTSASAPV